MVWSTPARCPLIGTLTSTGGLNVPVSGNGGQYLDHPPPALCKAGVSYSLTLHFQGSFDYPPMTDKTYC